MSRYFGLLFVLFFFPFFNGNADFIIFFLMCYRASLRYLFLFLSKTNRLTSIHYQTSAAAPYPTTCVTPSHASHSAGWFANASKPTPVSCSTPPRRVRAPRRTRNGPVQSISLRHTAPTTFTAFPWYMLYSKSTGKGNPPPDA